jgi:predicted N-acetyltransferase YhbS
MLEYIEKPNLTAADLAALFRSSGIRRPVEDLPRMERMLREANLVIAARHEGRWVGIARALTDFVYCCYLSDLAVAKEYQRQGIGRELLRRVRERLGEQSMLLLLAAPEAAEYYPRLGFEAVPNGWIIHRQR